MKKLQQLESPPERELAPIEYEPSLIEESVRWALEHGGSRLRYPRLLRLRLHNQRQLDAIYELPEGEQREGAFRNHFWKLFCELGFHLWLPQWLEYFPRLRTELESVVVRSWSGPFEEGAELWESREHRGEGIASYLVITLVCSRFNQPENLELMLLPHFQMAADLIDPDFGFQPGRATWGNATARDSIRATYQRLWELSARARLQSRGLLAEPQLPAEIQTLISGEPAAEAEPDAEELLATLGNPYRCNHRQLLTLASRLPELPHHSDLGSGPACPLCRFPTTDWAQPELLSELAPTIQVDFPDWSPSEGCCSHCAERYELLRASEEEARG